MLKNLTKDLENFFDKRFCTNLYGNLMFETK
jgi:hypothetical protein